MGVIVTSLSFAEVFDEMQATPVTHADNRWNYGLEVASTAGQAQETEGRSIKIETDWIDFHLEGDYATEHPNWAQLDINLRPKGQLTIPLPRAGPGLSFVVSQRRRRR